jgi:hypothetical protein
LNKIAALGQLGRSTASHLIGELRVRKILFGALFIVICIYGGHDAFAQCCCMTNVSDDIRGSRYATAYEELKNSDVVFLGQVVEMKMIDRQPEH